MNIALIVVDMQNDFSSKGAIPVTGMEKLIPVINDIIAQLQTKATVIFTADSHTQNSWSFRKNGGRWPVHCVEGTPGAQLVPGLVVPPGSHFLRKGMKDAESGYSAFSDGVMENGESLESFLHGQDIRCLYVMGVCTDYCVQETILDALKNGFSVIFVENASMGTSKEAEKEAKGKMTQAGAIVLETRTS